MRLRLLCAAAFGFLVFAVLPAHVTVMNDDFGYLRSVIETLQHRRPWTNDWLEPWAASLSGMSALLYLATHSFYFATYGLLAACAVASCFFFATILVWRGWTERRASFVAILVLTCASVFWKSIEFTSVALYLPCFIAALHTAEKRAWSGFALAWAVGMGARQGAIVWGVLPLWAFVLHLRSRRGWLAPLLAGLAGVAVFFALQTRMNVTQAQRLVTHPALSQLSAFHADGIALAALVYLAGAGLAAWIDPRASPTTTRSRCAVCIVGIILIVALKERSWFAFEHTCYDGRWGATYLKLLLTISVAGWSFLHIRLNLPYATLGLACAALVALRPEPWDYYFLEIGLLGFLGVRTVPPAQKDEPSRTTESLACWKNANALRAAAIGIIAFFHATLVLDVKCAVDRADALCRLSEAALREGRLRSEEISFAPFGFIGWKWQPYFVAHEGRDDPNLAGFGIYLKDGAVDVGQAYSPFLHFLPRFRHTPPADRSNLIASARSRFLWIFRAEYFLLRSRTPHAATHPFASPPTLPKFPLTAAEWRTAVSEK